MANYCTVSDLAIPLPNADTTLLTQVISTVSELIDIVCKRHFDTRVEPRRFTLPYNFKNTLEDFYANNNIYVSDILIDDLLSVTSVTLEAYQGQDLYTSTILDTDEYQLLELKENSGRYNRLTILSGSGDKVKIIGTWGYSASVPDVVESTAIYASRILYNQIVEKGLTSERQGNWNGTYSEIEYKPVIDFISTMLRNHKR